MKKPGGMMVAIGLGKPSKGKSILGLPGSDGPEESEDESGEGSEKKAYGSAVVKAMASRDPMAIYEAIADICRAASDGEDEYSEDDE